MRLLAILRLRLRSLFSRTRVEQELDDELQYHLDREMERGLSAGMASHDARHAALQSLRDIEQRKEECRDARGLNSLDHVSQDVRYAARQLRKSPAFACTAIFVLALGMAATAGIFAFVRAALIRPLPYRDQSRLVAAFESSPGAPRSWLSYLDLQDWKRLNNVFSSLDAYALNGSFTLTTRTGAEQVPGTRVSAGFFHTLGVVPAFGRDFHPGEDSPAAPRTVVLSYTAWQKRFAAKRDVLGRSLILNGNPAVIIGVLPRSFQFAPYGGAEFWATLRPSDACEQHRDCHNLTAIARLKDGISIETASVATRSIAQRLQREYPDTNRYFGSANLVPLRDFIIGDIRPILLVLISGAGILLLIACANVTALLLARSDRRRREIAVRGAIGASLSRLFQQFATEGFVLASAGCLVGLALTEGTIRLLTNLVPAEKMETMPYLRDASLDPATIAFACSIALIAGVLFSIIPMTRFSLGEMVGGLKEGSGGSSGITWRRFGSALVVIEVALAMVLLVSAGLLGKSLYQLLHVDIGFNPNGLAYFQTSWAPGRYDSNDQLTALDQRMLAEIRKLPGVHSVSTSTAPPIDSAWGTASFHIVGRPDHKENNEVINRQISPDYFTTLQARIWQGRTFTQADNTSQLLVAVVNRTLAKRYFSGEDPIGKQIYYDWAPQSPLEIVGIVDDVKEGNLEDTNWGVLYVPEGQHPVAWPALLIRTSQTQAELSREIPAAIHRIDPFITVSAREAMTERISNSPSAYLHSSAAWLVGAFASTALLLAIVGLYGVVAYSVSQRTREIGVRMAMGAQPRSVYRLILGEAGRLTAIGLVLGLLGSVAAAILLSSMLFGVQSWDPPTLLTSAGVLALAAVLATFHPAWRAASINPVEAIRTE